MNKSSQPSIGPSRKSGSGWNMEIVFAVIVSLVAIAAIIGSRGFPSTALSTDIGSGRFPLIYSIALLALSAILIVQNILKRGGTTAATAKGEATRPNYRKAFVGIVASLFSLAAMAYVGYAPVTAVYLSFLMWLLGMKHKVLNPLLAIAITGVLYFTFSNALHVPLPVGSLFE